MMNTLLRIVATGIAAVFLTAGVAFTQEPLLIVRGNENYPPYEMVENETLTGLHIELVEEIARQLNLSITFKSVPWKNAIRMVEKGEADAITYIGKTAEREAFVYFFDDNILSKSRFVFLASKERAGEIAYSGDLTSMKAYRIGVQRGYSYGEEFNAAGYLQKHEVNKKEQLGKLLAVGEIDLVAINLDEFKEDRKNGLWKNAAVLEPDITSIPSYIGFSKSKGRESLARQFAEAFAALKETEAYQRILTKYGD